MGSTETKADQLARSQQPPIQLSVEKCPCFDGPHTWVTAEGLFGLLAGSEELSAEDVVLGIDDTELTVIPGRSRIGNASYLHHLESGGTRNWPTTSEQASVLLAQRVEMSLVGREIGVILALGGLVSTLIEGTSLVQTPCSQSTLHG